MENLFLIDVSTEYFDSDFKSWANETVPFFAEGCLRKLMLCSHEDYAKLPEEKRKQLEKDGQKKGRGIYKNAPAYRRLLELYCGLHSDKHNDYHMAG